MIRNDNEEQSNERIALPVRQVMLLLLLEMNLMNESGREALDALYTHEFITSQVRSDFGSIAVMDSLTRQSTALRTMMNVFCAALTGVPCAKESVSSARKMAWTSWHPEHKLYRTTSKNKLSNPCMPVMRRKGFGKGTNTEMFIAFDGRNEVNSRSIAATTDSSGSGYLGTIERQLSTTTTRTIVSELRVVLEGIDYLSTPVGDDFGTMEASWGPHGELTTKFQVRRRIDRYRLC